MNKAIIIHLDNEKEKVLDTAKHYFDQLSLPIEYVCCSNVEQFNDAIKAGKNYLKAIVFDLLEKDEEISDHTKSSFNTAINNTFKNFNVPVFIYSGYLSNYNDFEYNGTVIKIDKGNKDGFKAVADKISLLHSSGFLEIFCPNGLVETQLHIELHKAFTQQFKTSNDIPNIIELIKKTASPEEYINRVKRVFTRIAVRSLMTELLSPEVDDHGDIKEEYVGITEHYVQRINKVQIWTGDIFKNKDTEERIFILMPRCNAVRCDDYLVCSFILGAEPQGMKTDKVEGLLTGDPAVSGYDRYLPVSPIYKGGKIALSKFSMKSKSEILDAYQREISLSDELTNEVLGKFASYFFRTGITPFQIKEGKEEYKAAKDGK